MKKLIPYIIIIISTAIWSGSAVFLFMSLTTVKDEAPVIDENEICTNYCESITDESLYRKFFYTRFVLVGEKEDGSVISLVSYIYAKQIGIDKYRHYYTFVFSSEGENETLYIDQNSNSKDILAADFIKEFNENDFDGQSTQREYDFVMQTKQGEVEVEITDINGDFITKDQPDYIRYASIGNATIKMNGEEYKVNAFVDNIVSSDYSISLFYENRDELINKTHSLSLWDEEGAFYLIDITDVENTDHPYKSHKWVLYKDKNGFSKKYFDAEMEYKTNVDGKPDSWSIYVPDFDGEFELFVDFFTERNQEKGIVRGKVINESESLNLIGHFLYNENP